MCYLLSTSSLRSPDLNDIDRAIMLLDVDGMESFVGWWGGVENRLGCFFIVSDRYSVLKLTRIPISYENNM